MSELPKDVTEKITGFVAQLYEGQAPACLDPELPFESLGLDYLACMELVMQIEDEFGIVISDEDAQSFTTIHSIVDYLRKSS